MALVVGVHQPNFLPWIGYFRKMVRCDIFVLLDHVSFSRSSYTHRVRIAGDRWLTVPVTHRFGQAINEVCVANTEFVSSHEGILKSAYQRNPAVADYIDVIREIDRRKLVRVNWAGIEFVRSRLDIHTPVVWSSELAVSGAATQGLLSIMQALGGDVYLSGSGGEQYQDVAAFRDAGVEVLLLARDSEREPPSWLRGSGGRSTLDSLADCPLSQVKDWVFGD